MQRVRVAIVCLLCLIVGAASAQADASLFVGADTTPVNHPVRGLAFGAGLLVVAFEFEYAAAAEDTKAAAPALKTGSGNVIFQTPMMLHGFQPYVTMGGGLYRERLGSAVDTSFAGNTGGGVKIALAGPLRLRVDYRVFKLGHGALYSPAHRVYVGLNLKF